MDFFYFNSSLSFDTQALHCVIVLKLQQIVTFSFDCMSTAAGLWGQIQSKWHQSNIGALKPGGSWVYSGSMTAL